MILEPYPHKILIILKQVMVFLQVVEAMNQHITDKIIRNIMITSGMGFRNQNKKPKEKSSSTSNKSLEI
jgi:hypothetical protein